MALKEYHLGLWKKCSILDISELLQRMAMWAFYLYHFPTTTPDTTIQPRLQSTRVLIHNVRSLYVSLHSHCTCSYIRGTTERPVCVCPLDLRTR
jgi:hypothetical protein